MERHFQFFLPEYLIEKILGISLDKEEISKSIIKMGGTLIDSRTVTDGTEKIERWADCMVGEKEHIIAMPRWRNDIMHPIDIVEDIAEAKAEEESEPVVLEEVTYG